MTIRTQKIRQRGDLRIDRVHDTAGTAASSSSDHEKSAAQSADDPLLVILSRRWKLISACVGVALVPAAAYLLISPKIYTASARLQVTKPAAVAVANGQQAGVGGDESVSPESFLPTQAQLFKTTPILATAIDTVTGGKPDGFASFDGIQRPLTYLKRKLDVDVDKKADLITVAFASKYPDEANQLVDAVVAAYRKHIEQQQRQRVEQVLGALKSEKQNALKELEQVNLQLLRLKQAYNVLSFGDDKDNFARARLTSLSDATSAARLETVAARTSFDAAARSVGLDPEAFLQTSSNTGVALSQQDEELLRAELFTTRQQLAERRRTFMADHPLVHTLEAKLNQLNLAYVSAARARWQLAIDKEKQLQQSFDEQQRVALQLSSKADEAAQLQSQSKKLLEHCEQIDARSRDLAVTVGAGMLNVVVQEPASWEANDIAPSKSKVMGLFAMLGLLAGCGVALAKEWLDPKLRSEDQVAEALGLPVLATLPRAAGARSMELPAAACQWEPHGALAQAANGLATVLRLTQRDVRTILVTSPARGDGKSTIAANLATALAQIGERVLLIDADLRGGGASPHRFLASAADGITNITGAADSAGLVGMLAHSRPLERCIVRTAMPNLNLLPAGDGHDAGDVAELLNSPTLTGLLGLLKDQYDHVIVDAPSLSTAEDARIVAASCDGTIVVMRAGNSSRRAAEDAKNALLDVGANIAGIVLNDPSESRAPHLGRNGHSNGNGNGNGNGSGNGRAHDSRVRGIWADRAAVTEPAPAGAVEEPSLEL